jgi:acetyl-CoA carboxylase biotin carboxyl carrier protein
MDLRKIKKLIDLLEESNLAEIEIKEGEESVRSCRARPGRRRGDGRADDAGPGRGPRPGTGDADGQPDRGRQRRLAQAAGRPAPGQVMSSAQPMVGRSTLPAPDKPARSSDLVGQAVGASGETSGHHRSHEDVQLAIEADIAGTVRRVAPRPIESRPRLVSTRIEFEAPHALFRSPFLIPDSRPQCSIKS